MSLPVTVNAFAPILSEEVKTQGAERPALLVDTAGVKVVVQDASTAEAWLGSQQWSMHWRESDILYQSPRSIAQFENSATTRSNVSRFTVAKHVNALVPTMMSGMFYDSPPFILRPRPGTTQTTVRAKAALFSALLDDIDFKTEVERFLECMCLNGTGVAKWGWTRECTVEKHFIRKKNPPKVNLPFTGETTIHTEESDEFDVKEIEITKNRPFFEQKPLGTVFVDPKWRHSNQIWKAGYVIDRQYLTFNDLNKLRGNCKHNADGTYTGYNIPEELELKKLFFGDIEMPAPVGSVEQQQKPDGVVHHAAGREEKTSADPLLQVLKVDERWDKDRVITVIQDKLEIRNELHGLGRICFLSGNWWNIQNAGWGIGVGRLIGTEQRVEQGVTNAALDILSYAVNPQFARSRGANVQAQQIRQRLMGIVDVDGPVKDAFGLIEQPKIPGEVWEVIANSKQSAESVTGADEAMVQGALPSKGGSSLGRTATGAGNLAAASATRIQGPVGRFVDNVFIPFLVAMDDMIRENMPLAEIRAILADEMTDAATVDFDNFMNARLKFEVLAGAHLAAKKAMGQSLPLMIQILENPHLIEQLNQTGWTVDVREIFEMFMEMSEWKNTREVIRLMNKTEAALYQQAQQMNAAAEKLKADITKIDAKHHANSMEIDQKAEARLASKISEDALDRAGGYVERRVAENAMQPQALGTKDAQYHSTAQ